MKRPHRTSRHPRLRTTLRSAAAALSALALGATLVACGSDAASGEPRVNVVAFQEPSLGAFLPAIIESRGIDNDHGLDLRFTYATPDNYNTEFSAGHFDVGASAALLSEALRTERGSKVTYLFNLFDYWGTVVTKNSGIKSLGDLSGHSLAAATGTTNYAMFAWFAKKAGLNLSSVDTQNQTTSGLSTMAKTGRTDATELWEPAYSTLTHGDDSISTVNLDYGAWEKAFGTDQIPYLGVAATTAWADKHPDEVQKLYDIYKDAADWVQQHPADAAKIIAKDIPGGNAEVIETLIKNNDRLQLDVQPAAKVANGIRSVFKAGIQTGYLTKQPPKSIIYSGLK